MITCIGEILIDLIGHESKNDLTFEAHVGGAPFNVAYNLAYFDNRVNFIGRIGNDLMGQYILKVAKKVPFNYLDIKIKNQFNTTLALVNIDNDGERHFSFMRENTADYQFEFKDLDLNIIAQSKIVHIGSLMLNNQIGLDFINVIIPYLKSNNVLFSFDVNYRDDILKDKIDVLKAIILKADIVKLSLDEIVLFSSKLTLKEKIDDIFSQNQLVFITLGSEGSKLFYQGEEYYAPSIKVDKVIDTTGAGDAFYAQVLAILDQKDYHQFKRIDFINMLSKANQNGAKTTLIKGAIDLKLLERGR